jgi:hypothetical protein
MVVVLTLRQSYQDLSFYRYGVVKIFGWLSPIIFAFKRDVKVFENSEAEANISAVRFACHATTLTHIYCNARSHTNGKPRNAAIGQIYESEARVGDDKGFRPLEGLLTRTARLLGSTTIHPSGVDPGVTAVAL